MSSHSDRDAALASFGAAILCAAFSAPREELEQENNIEAVQALPGLHEWLDSLKLGAYHARAETWCREQGAASLSEVKEEWTELADFLNLKILERKRVERDVAGVAPATMGIHAAVSPASIHPTCNLPVAPVAPGAATSASVAATLEAEPVTQPSAFAPTAAAATATATAGSQPESHLAAPPLPAAAVARPTTAAPGQVAEDGGDGSPFSPSSPSKLCGTTFGPREDHDKYKLIERIGTGATAQVWRCTSKDGNTYASKNISLAKLKLSPNYQEISDMLFQEIGILLSLEHPNIVSLYDIIQEDSAFRLVMEIVEGGGLDARICAKKYLDEPEASSIFAHVSDGLTYIHSRGVVHRDLKPDNILLRTGEDSRVLQVKITDFGHSGLVGTTDVVGSSQLGTPLYMAPEVFTPNGVQPGQEFKVDLWSLGVILYAMLMGSCPFGSSDRLEEEIQKGDLDFWSDDDRPPPSKEAQNLIRNLIRVDPTKRLALEWCSVHPFVAAPGSMLRQILRNGGWNESIVVEDKFTVPDWLTQQQLRQLRQDLNYWMVKFRYAALMVGKEVTICFGSEDSLDVPKASTARTELLQLMQHHTGLRRPTTGNGAKYLESSRHVQGAPQGGVQVVVVVQPKLVPAVVPQGRNGNGGPSLPLPGEVTTNGDSTAHSPSRHSREDSNSLSPGGRAHPDEDDAAARRRRLEARKQRAAGGQGPKWNFSGQSASGPDIDDRFREHESELDRRRRLAFRGGGGLRAEREDDEDRAQKAIPKAK